MTTELSENRSMEDVLSYVDSTAEERSASCLKAMFYFLYKEILMNRIRILEADTSGNRGAIQHNERIVVELNRKLMEQMS